MKYDDIQVSDHPHTYNYLLVIFLYATAEKLICTVSIGKINYRCLQKIIVTYQWNELRYGTKIFTVVFAMDRGIDYWVSFSSIHFSSLPTKSEKNQSHTISST